MNGVSIRIADELHPERLFRSGEEGQVLVRADSMFEGYLDGPPPSSYKFGGSSSRPAGEQNPELTGERVTREVAQLVIRFPVPGIWG